MNFDFLYVLNKFRPNISAEQAKFFKKLGIFLSIVIPAFLLAVDQRADYVAHANDLGGILDWICDLFVLFGSCLLSGLGAALWYWTKAKVVMYITGGFMVFIAVFFGSLFLLSFIPVPPPVKY
jgi:hypothetical protein